MKPPRRAACRSARRSTKTAKPDVFEVDFPIKPGETRFDLTYTVPYTEGAPYDGKILTKDENTYLIVPNGVTLAGDGLNDLGRSRARRRTSTGFAGSAYKIQLTGAVAPAGRCRQLQRATARTAARRSSRSCRACTARPSRILALALGILALGFALLYRAKGPAQRKESE